jgi:hypothetical protein
MKSRPFRGSRSMAFVARTPCTTEEVIERTVSTVVPGAPCRIPFLLCRACRWRWARGGSRRGRARTRRNHAPARRLDGSFGRFPEKG